MEQQIKEDLTKRGYITEPNDFKIEIVGNKFVLTIGDIVSKPIDIPKPIWREWVLKNILPL